MRIILIFTLLVIIGICGEENHDESNLDLYFVARKKEPGNSGKA